MLLLNSEVRKVLHENGKAVGVSITTNGSTSKVYGKNIILSAGALETPRILQHSGVKEAGKGISLDVFQSTYGYTEDVGMKNEPVMAVYLDKFIEDKGLFLAPYMYPTHTLVRDLFDFAPIKLGAVNQLKMLIKARKVKAKRLIGMMEELIELHSSLTFSILDKILFILCSILSLSSLRLSLQVLGEQPILEE